MFGYILCDQNVIPWQRVRLFLYRSKSLFYAVTEPRVGRANLTHNRTYVGLEADIVSSIVKLSDPDEARGCSTNTFVINSFIDSLTL